MKKQLIESKVLTEYAKSMMGESVKAVYIDTYDLTNKTKKWIEDNSTKDFIDLDNDIVIEFCTGHKVKIESSEWGSLTTYPSE